MRCCLASSGSGAAGTALNVLSTRGVRTGGLYFRNARGTVSTRRVHEVLADKV